MKKVVKIAVLLAIIILITRIEKEFKSKEFFIIQNVEINKISPELSKEIFQLKKEIIGRNINTINISELEKKMLKDPRIISVKISKKNLNNLKFEIKEAQTSYYLQYHSQIYTANENGIIFGKMEEYPKKSLPILYMRTEDDKKNLIQIVDDLNGTKLKDDISQVYIENNDTIIILLKEGIKIKTNITVAKERYTEAYTLYTGLKKLKEIEYIDIRFKDMVVKEKEKVDGQQDDR